MSRRSLPGRVLRALGWLALSFVLATVLPVALLRWVDPPTTAFMLRDRLIAAWHDDEAYRFRHEWTAWPEISREARLAVIAAEDQKFAAHFGFDIESIAKALEERRGGGRTRGASTLTQQVAKNLFLWPGQSWVRKGLEAWLTVLIEALWSKQRILEVYLNVAEFGRGIYGVGAASEAFYRKAPGRLTAREAALLAAVLPSPQRFRVTAPSAYVRKRQQWILGQMRALRGEPMLAALL